MIVWDYIVVGGGIAGSVLSNRLLQFHKAARILVIEAGPDVSNRTDLFYPNSTNTLGGDFDWKYMSVPQANYNGRQVMIPAGRCLGGGSAINSCKWPLLLDNLLALVDF
jgi:choline dehydrogenase